MSIKTWLAVAVTLLFWSSAFAGIRSGLLGGYHPGQLVLLRFLCASAVFLLVGLIRGIRVPEPRDMVRIAVLGLTGISVYHICLTFGELSVPAGTAGLIIGAAPAFTALLAAFALNERLNVIGWGGLLLGFLGIMLIAFGTPGGHSFTKGAILILISAVATSFFFVYQKPLFAKYSALELTSYFTWVGTIPMLVFLPGLIPQMVHASLSATLSGVYIGVFPAAIAYVAWGMALSSGKASTVTSTLYLDPALAILIAWLWLGEIPHWISIIGGIIAMVGVVVVHVWGTAHVESGERGMDSDPVDGGAQGTSSADAAAVGVSVGVSGLDAGALGSPALDTQVLDS